MQSTCLTQGVQSKLPEGVTKLKERAVAGSKTTATYTVIKDGKELHKNVFNSSYVPWQAKYCRGAGGAQ